MPNKKTHQKLSLLTATCSIPAVFFLDFPQFLCLEAGILVTLIPEFTPDLDVNNRRFGTLSKLVGMDAYARLVPHRYGLRKRHWSRLRIWNIFFLSHIPFMGTIPRTFLLLTPVLFVILIFELFYTDIFVWILFIYLGMSISDTVHTLSDKIYSFIRGKVAFKETDKEYWQRRRRYNEKSPL